ncbi:Hypothetical protein R9X50_00728600 [Acrodontium crateriforme]|uniref:DUF1446-domain-containing protein n=1 Tax=Acrodontium crateriforme TaxID=150365 RepID=A0AAQ3RCN9_9PEZI|nr:Hypothetical protein R9X50_00728600 [Acrodontium crateriforme]
MLDMERKRAVRIAGCSGSATDRRHAMALLAHNHPHDPIDVIIGDWLSEANMTSRAALAVDSAPSKDSTSSFSIPSASGKSPGDAYEPSFLEALEPALDDIAKYGIKLAVNAGASATAALHRDVTKMVTAKNLALKIAWISGDDVFATVQQALKKGDHPFTNICTSEPLAEWRYTPIAAQAYLGGVGIAIAFHQGADIVICGRVSDASPVIGAAMWWHNWKRTQLDELANAFVAGHLIECSSYVCGGNFSGFKSLETKGWDDIGFPIAEIEGCGQVTITKNNGSGGEISTQTCSAQLLYEIQGPWYFNSDVTAVLSDIRFEQLASDRVALHGIKALPPPPTTKIGITARGGYQAEVHWFLVGLDIAEKARMLETQIRRLLRPFVHNFTLLTFTVNGSVREDASSQNAATVDFRVFAQAPRAEDLAPERFFRPVVDPIMQSYPGATPHLDWRQAFPKPIYEYFVTLLPQTSITHKLHLWTGEGILIPPPPLTREFPAQQPSLAVAEVDETMLSWGKDTTTQRNEFWGPTVRGPLGWIVHARSGDKGSNANVGFWVRFQDEWEWLRRTLSTERIKMLLADEWKQGKKIDRFELPNIYAVHFLLHDHLDRGVSCSSTYDFLGKNVAEFLRSKHVDIPLKFLNRGKL